MSMFIDIKNITILAVIQNDMGEGYFKMHTSRLFQTSLIYINLIPTHSNRVSLTLHAWIHTRIKSYIVLPRISTLTRKVTAIRSHACFELNMKILMFK